MADRGSSPVSQEAPPSPSASPATAQEDPSAAGFDGEPRKKPKRNKKPKRKAAALEGGAVGGAPSEDGAVEAAVNNHKAKTKKAKKKHKEKEKEGTKASSVSAAEADRKKPRKKPAVKAAPPPEGLSDAQKAANEQMRRVLEEDQYSANGSIVDTDSEKEDNFYRGEIVRMDRGALMAAMRKQLWMERLNSGTGNVVTPKAGAGAGGGNAGANGEDDDDDDSRHPGRKSKKKKGKKGGPGGPDDRGRMSAEEEPVETSRTADAIVNPSIGVTAADDVVDDYDDRDGGSIFGQTTGASAATWVECDKCKKWRRLRGVVDEKKLPSRWYCSMNKNDPERARCSAPEEEYETPHTPESAADARTRKHLRVWVRRLQCNEAYESRQPTLTRGRKKATATSKEPYEWVRCCNQSCGKWRAILRIMDAKTSVIERTRDGEWYCVMNTWDEKTASCAAPQENLPAIGCPMWVHQDEK